MAIDYLDFDLAIEAIDALPGRYRARVQHSPAGEASVEFELPFSALELENYILKMGRPRQGVRGPNSTEGRAAQEFGRKVYAARGSFGDNGNYVLCAYRNNFVPVYWSDWVGFRVAPGR